MLSPLRATVQKLILCWPIKLRPILPCRAESSHSPAGPESPVPARQPGAQLQGMKLSAVKAESDNKESSYSLVSASNFWETFRFPYFWQFMKHVLNRSFSAGSSSQGLRHREVAGQRQDMAACPLLGRRLSEIFSWYSHSNSSFHRRDILLHAAPYWI